MPYRRCLVCKAEYHYRGAPNLPAIVPCAQIGENMADGQCQWPRVPNEYVPSHQQAAWHAAQWDAFCDWMYDNAPPPEPPIDVPDDWVDEGDE